MEILNTILEFIKNLGSGIWIAAAVAILPLILNQIKIVGSASALEMIMYGLGKSMSLFLKTNWGVALEKIVEKFSMMIAKAYVIFPVLAWFQGMRADNKDKAELNEQILIIKAALDKICGKVKK